MLSMLTYKMCLKDGGVSEWFKELVLKTSDPERDRGFESHPLRHKKCGEVLKLAEEVPLLRA